MLLMHVEGRTHACIDWRLVVQMQTPDAVTFLCKIANGVTWHVGETPGELTWGLLLMFGCESRVLICHTLTTAARVTGGPRTTLTSLHPACTEQSAHQVPVTITVSVDS